MRSFFIRMLLVASPISQVLAQGDTLSTRFLDEVVISASRTEQLVKKVPRSVTVIDQLEIDQSIYNSVGDLLIQQEGIYIVGANQTPGTNQSLFMRGAGSNQTLVLIDGVRVTDPSTPNNAVDLAELSLSQVERIEILRGSHSTLYGGGAIGGVVNIITKKKSEAGLRGLISVSAGSLGDDAYVISQQGNLGYAFQNGIYLNGGFFNQNVNGLDATIDTASFPFQKPDKDDFSKTDGNFTVGYQKDALSAFGSYRSTHQNADIDNGAFSDDDNSSLSFDRNFWSYGVAYTPSSRLEIKANGSLSNSRRLSENDSSLVGPGVYDNNYFLGKYNGESTTHELQASYDLDDVEFLLGLGRYTEDMDFSTYFYSSAFGGFESKVDYDSIELKTSTNYVFGQMRISPVQSKKLNFLLGSRYSNHSRFGSFLTFELSPSYALSANTFLYASFSTAFNAPSLYQLFDPTSSSQLFSRGNSMLEPEKSRSIEIGVKKDFGKGGFMTASLFTTRVSNAIEYVYVWDRNTPIGSLSFGDYLGDTYINVAVQEVSGAELSGQVNYRKLNVEGNVTLLRGRITNDPADVESDNVADNHIQLFNNGAFLTVENEQTNLSRRPRVTAFVRTKYNINNGVSVFVNYRLTGSRFDSVYDPTLGPFGALGSLDIDSYNLIDFGANFRLNKSTDISFRADNIFDTDYQEINGFSTRGRSFYLKLNFSW